MAGEADGYYSNQGGYENQGQYAAPNGQPQYAPPQGPPQNQQYAQKPPGYGPSLGPQGDFANDKPTFEQAFKVDKPKWNDLWATALFLAVFAGFVAVSGIAIQGYGKYTYLVFKHFLVLTIRQLRLRASTEAVSTTVQTISVLTPTHWSSSSSVLLALSS